MNNEQKRLEAADHLFSIMRWRMSEQLKNFDVNDGQGEGETKPIDQRIIDAIGLNELSVELAETAEVWYGQPKGQITVHATVEKVTFGGKEVVVNLSVLDTIDNKVSLASIGKMVNIIGMQLELPTDEKAKANSIS